MAPSMESLNPMERPRMEAPSTYSIKNKTVAMGPPTKTVAFAVNYELAMVDQFLCAEKRTRVIRVETPTDPTTSDLCVRSSIKPSLPSSLLEETEEDAHSNTSTSDEKKQIRKSLHDDRNGSHDTFPPECDESSFKRPPNTATAPITPTTVLVLSPECSVRRVSTRDKHKREAPLARNRIRYDMQLVPPVRRNPVFLDSFHKWWFETCRTQELNKVTHLETKEECMPFEEDSSVLWIPSKRSEWEDSISEMTAVCTCAAILRLRRGEAGTLKPPDPICDNILIDTVAPLPSRPFLPPLSINYIRDRIDIDDPLKGYQIRHKYGGWLQGFILYTHFTTWTYGFHWDSQHSLCGIPSHADDAMSAERQNARQVDDGTLSRELENLPRSGDPGAGGIVFPAIAEISLLGGLGCGQYLLRMALDDIRATRHYKYVALEAAEQAVPFYERFGFVRVGAICRYGKPELDSAVSEPQQPAEPSIVGYRHWTHSNESERSLKLRGPSYMMCLKLPELDSATFEAASVFPSFVEQMHSLQVASKPRVEHLGASATPGPKVSARRSNSMPINISAYHDTSGNSSPRDNGPVKRGRPPRRKSMVVSPTPPLSIMTPLVESVSIPLESVAEVQLLETSAMNTKVKPPRVPKRVFSLPDIANRISDRSTRKRPSSSYTCAISLPAGRPLTFVEKQYHSVWLAVPPNIPPTLSISRSTQNARASIKHRDETKGETKSSKRARTTVKSGVGSSCLKVTQPKSKSSRKEIKPKSPAKLKSKSILTFSTADSGRIYHSIRGIDGKFMRVYEDDPMPTNGMNPVVTSRRPTIKKLSSKLSSVTLEPDAKKRRLNSSESTDSRSGLSTLLHVGNSVPFDKKTLRKQKVKSYPRNHVHFFNRVVKPKISARDDNLYFVAEYDDENSLLRLIPMVASGTLLGQREGRPRYQCVIGDTDENFMTVSTADYEIVRSAVVMKTPFIASEAWDVETDADSNFQTR